MMSGQLIYLITPAIFFAWLELSHRLRPHSPLQLKTFDWSINKEGRSLKAVGYLEIRNPHPRMEVMVPEFEIKPKLIGKEKVNEIQIKTVIRPDHPEENLRKDGYWQAYIVKSKKSTRIYVSLELLDAELLNPTELVDNVWLDIHWVNYGPFGRIKLQQGFVVPVKYPLTLVSRPRLVLRPRLYPLTLVNPRPLVNPSRSSSEVLLRS